MRTPTKPKRAKAPISAVSGGWEEIILPRDLIGAQLAWDQAKRSRMGEVSISSPLIVPSRGRVGIWGTVAIELRDVSTQVFRVDLAERPTTVEEFLEEYGLAESFAEIGNLLTEVFGNRYVVSQQTLREDPAFEGLYVSMTAALEGVSREALRELRPVFDRRMAEALSEDAHSRFVITLIPNG